MAGGIYTPGKTAEEMKAQMAAAEAERARLRAEKQPRTVTLTVGDWSDIDTAIPDVIELLTDLGNVLNDLAYDRDLDRPCVDGVLRLAARAIRSMEAKEINAIDQLDEAIRRARPGRQKP